MKVSLNWLNDYLDLKDISKEELFNTFSFHISELEAAYELTSNTNLTIGYVKECVNHPDSDHLHVCQIEIKPGVISQIVCGAPNMSQGKKVIVALPGAILPGDFKIKPSKIRGVESNGMCCSLQELGIKEMFVEEAYKDGIYLLDDNAPIGENPLHYLGLDDYVFDLDLTSNRSDLLSVEGIAYDLGAALNKKVKQQKFDLVESQKVNDIKVSIDTPLCKKYLTRKIENVEIKSSPEFIKSRLIACGIRPINNVVDITNYVLLELGQPLHSFDADKLGNNILVRESLEGEEITTLDNEQRKLPQGSIVITNGNDALCVAGVMGGLSTEITSETKNVVLEAAYFDPMSIRKTSQALGLRSESSTRFERTIDYNRVNRALDYAAYLLSKYANGTVLKGVNGIEENYQEKHTTVTLEKINKVLGTNLTNDEVKDIFNRLDYTYEGDNEYNITIPSRRMDLLESYQDIIEDVARMYGYDNIPTVLPKTNDSGSLTEYQKLVRNCRIILSNMTINEAVTYSLTNEEELYSFVKTKEEPIKLLMPMTEDRAYMRQSLIPSLINTIVYNKARKINDLSFFEIGKVYNANEEVMHLAGAFNGLFTSSKWQGKKTVVDFYLVKGILEILFEKLNLNAEFISYKELENMHPGRTAKIIIDDKEVGFVGEIHPRYAHTHSCDNTYVFELNLDLIYQCSKKVFKYESICKFPSVTRDLAIVVNKDVTCKEVIDVIKMTSKKYLTNFEVFDLYQGENVGENEKSLAISLTFEDKERTLETADVDKIINSILNRLDALLHAHLR